MGNQVLSTLTDAAEQSARSRGAEGSSWFFPWASTANEVPEISAHRSSGSAQRRQPRGRHVQGPRSAHEASEMWGDIDTTKVDVGALAPRILQAQREIPIHNVRPVYRIENAHECYVRILVWDPFRDLLISGGGDGWVRFWSTTDYGLEDEINTKCSVRSLLVLTSALVSGHNNGQVKIWDMENPGRRRLQSLKAHRECVYALSMLRSGELITGAENIRVFLGGRGHDYELTKTIPGDILCICAVPGPTGDSQVVTGNVKGRITVWNTTAPDDHHWSTTAVCEGHLKSVWALVHVKDANVVASGSADKSIRLWSTETWQCKHELREHSGWVVGLSCGPGWLLSCSIDKSVKAWNVKTPRWSCERTMNNQNAEVYSVCAFAGGRFASGGAEMSVVVYDGPVGGARDQHSRDARQIPEARNTRQLVHQEKDGWARGHNDATGERSQNEHRPVVTAAFGSSGSREGTPPRNRQVAGSRQGSREGTPPRNRQVAGSRQGTPPRGQRNDNVEPEKQDDDILFETRRALPRVNQENLEKANSDDDLLFETRRALPRTQITKDEDEDMLFETKRALPRFEPEKAIDDDLLFETKRAIPRNEYPEMKGPCLGSLQYKIGDAASVYSSSQKRWLNARVIEVNGPTVTVAYRFPCGEEAKKQMLATSDNLRPIQQGGDPARLGG